MQNTKYLKLIRAFSEEESRSFRDFIYSPYFNSRKQLQQLYQLVEQHREEEYAKVDLWRSLFPEKSAKHPSLSPPEAAKADKHIRKLLSDLAKLAEEFLEVEGLRKDKWGRRQYFLSELKEHDLDHYYMLNREKFVKELENQEGMTEEALTLEKDYYFFQINRGKHPDNINLESVLSLLDEDYLINKLRFACEILVYYRMFGREKEIPDLKIDPESIPASSSLLQAYLQVFQLLSTPPGGAEQGEMFVSIRSLMKENQETFPPEHWLNIYNQLQNYCIYQVNAGKNREFFLNQIFEISRDRIYQQEEIAAMSLKNAISAALSIGKTEEAAEMLTDVQHKLPEQLKEESVNFNQAQICFFKGDYSECKKYLAKLNLNDRFHALESRTLEWKSWIASGEPDSLEFALTRINNNLRYLDRITYVPAKRLIRWRNRLKFAKRILQGRTPKEKLREQIMNEPKLIDRAYLLNILEDLN